MRGGAEGPHVAAEIVVTAPAPGASNEKCNSGGVLLESFHLICGPNFPITHRYGFGEDIDIPHNKIHDTLIRRIGEIRADF